MEEIASKHSEWTMKGLVNQQLIGGGTQQPAYQRNAGLDIVRTIACLSVIASHYFLHSKFNTAPFDGPSMFLQGMLSSMVIGSDLYMILTGFLCSNKTPNKKFYMSGIKVLLSYIFFSILTIIVNIYYFHTGMTWKSGLMGILNFSTIPYAWYIEMWIGLFILAPFINIWYKALHNKKSKLQLIAILLLISGLPDFFNRYGLYIVPAFWEGIYPIAFYLTGCFLREYRPSFNKLKLSLFILAIVSINSLVTVVSGHDTYLHIIGDRNGIFMSSLAIALFLICYNVTVDNGLAKGIFQTISLRSLDIFLSSAIFDFYLYPYFMENYFRDQAQFGIYYFIIVPLIFAICFIVASIKRIIFYLLQKPLTALNIPIQLQNKAA